MTPTPLSAFTVDPDGADDECGMEGDLEQELPYDPR